MPDPTQRQDVFHWALLGSLLLHSTLWTFSAWQNHVLLSETPSPMEIDLTRPFRITSDPKLARRAVVSGTGAPLVESPKPLAAPGPAVKAQEWILPGAKTVELVKPTTAESLAGGQGTEDGPGGGLGGLGDGTGGGEVDWVYLTEVPQLLNRNELLRNMKKFYPPEERAAGREGVVALTVHINEEGRVILSDVAHTSSAAFDQAAKRVLAVAKFSPARIGKKAVPVKMKQSVYFQLEQ
jgi:TonB family protein